MRYHTDVSDSLQGRESSLLYVSHCSCIFKLYLGKPLCELESVTVYGHMCTGTW